MSVPQIKDRPASALRAMFAGIGSLLHVGDKARAKSAEQAPAETEAPTPAATAPEGTAPKGTAPEDAVPETTDEPEATAEPEAAVTVIEPEAVAEAEPVAEAVAEPTAEVEAEAEPIAEAEAEVVAEVEVETVIVVETDTETDIVVIETIFELPLSNYDESSVASLRARLRNLSVEQLTQLIEYERGNANRADVVTMFERRIVKVQAEA